MDYFEIEQSVLGSLIKLGDPNTEIFQKAIGKLRESTFNNYTHKVIFRAITYLAKTSNTIDMFTIEARLIATGDGGDKGTFSYIGEVLLKSSLPTLMNQIEILRENAIRITANNKLNEALATLNDKDGVSVYKKLGCIESELTAILGRALNNKESGLRHISDVASEWHDDVEKRFSGDESVKGFTTGIETLDGILAPKHIPKGSLVVVGARPKMGKTAFLNNIVKHFALDIKKTVVEFSLEMPSKDLFERMLTERANVSPDILYHGASNDSDWAKVSEAMGEYINSSFYIDDTPGISLSHIQSESRRIAKEKEVGVIAVDYLTLMKVEKAERNDLAYGEITKSLKNLAKELGCVVVLLTQLNRSLEQRSDKRPVPSDSRDTGQIEQDCDVWIGLYREGVYKELPPEQAGLTEAIVRLNRHGKNRNSTART